MTYYNIALIEHIDDDTVLIDNRHYGDTFFDHQIQHLDQCVVQS